MLPNDEIRIEELELTARVGVSEEERAEAQRITVSLVLRPRTSFARLEDDLSRTIDYTAVCAELKKFTATRSDKLIETLADAMAEHLLSRFSLRDLEVEVRKFVLPETRHVAVRVFRAAPPLR